MSQDASAWGTRGTTGVSFAATLAFDAVDVMLGGRVVLEQFSLTLRPGEIVCLLGESGSGKSTALRVAAGIQPVSAGTVSINGEIVSARGRTVPPDRRGIGLMFQDFALIDVDPPPEQSLQLAARVEKRHRPLIHVESAAVELQLAINK